MTRVLWLDDQPSVVESFASSLKSQELRFEVCNSGDEGLTALRTGRFDVVLTDLSMPPGTWGGLDFLERARGEGWAVPILVVSGEGGQAETVRALRLGANDYITKEEVGRDLEERIESVLADAAVAALANLQDSAPSPIAVPLRRFHAARHPGSQLTRLCEFFEHAIRLVSSIGIAELYATGGWQEVAALVGNGLKAPSAGQWNQWRVLLAKRLEETSEFVSCNHAFRDDDCDAVLQMRNDLAHGGFPDDARSMELLGGQRPAMDRLVRRLAAVGFPALVTVEELEFNGNEFSVNVRVLRGHSAEFPRSSRPSRAPLVKGHAYASDGIRDVWLDLDPLVRVAGPGAASATSCQVFDACLGRHGQGMAQSVRWIDIFRQERVKGHLDVTEPGLAGALAAYQPTR